jgi:hypothetical protein
LSACAWGKFFFAALKAVENLFDRKTFVCVRAAARGHKWQAILDLRGEQKSRGAASSQNTRKNTLR